MPINISLFVMINIAELSKTLDIAKKPSAELVLCDILGALGRKFESHWPELLFGDSLIYL